MTPAKYYRYITQRYDSQADRDLYREQQMFNSAATVEVEQNVDWLGGTLYASSSLNYLRNFGETTYTQYSSVPFQLGYTQDLLGYNAFKWDKRIEPLKYEKTQKQYIYNLETASEEAITYFFALAMAQSEYKMAQDNVTSSDTLYAIGKMRYKIASISQADLLTLNLDKVNAGNSSECTNSIETGHVFAGFLFEYGQEYGDRVGFTFKIA
jgi:outer membrane protein TolC